MSGAINDGTFNGYIARRAPVPVVIVVLALTLLSMILTEPVYRLLLLLRKR